MKCYCCENKGSSNKSKLYLHSTLYSGIQETCHLINELAGRHFSKDACKSCENIFAFFFNLEPLET